MEQSAKNRIKKFLTLIKQAQNIAFVRLVTNNIKVELGLKPWKILRLINTMVNEFVKSNSDFTRMKVNEELISCLLDFANTNGYDIFIKSIVNRLNSEDNKSQQQIIEKLESCEILAIDFQDEKCFHEFVDRKLSLLTLPSLIKYHKNIYHDLMVLYEPLLADITFNDQGPAGGQKDDIKKILMESAIGKHHNSHLKLSDFIDENFFEDIDSQDNTSVTQHNDSQQQKEKQPVQSLINQLIHKQDVIDHLVEIPNNKKRVKTSSTGASQMVNKYLVMSPILGLLIHFTQKLTSNCWKQRQSAAINLKAIVSNFNLEKHFECYIIQFNQQKGEYSLKDRLPVSYKKLLQNILPRLQILQLKDNFSDFEELKMLCPAREEASFLMEALQRFDFLEEDFALIIQQLPMILKSVEKENWIARYNFFLIIKALLYKHSEQIFQVFHKVLIESLLIVEDEVMITITEIIESLLHYYLKQHDYSNSLTMLISNLQQNLSKSDEIEVSAISVFNLIKRILELAPNTNSIELHFDVQIFCPFNFHKVINVRYSYNQIVSKYLQCQSLPLADLRTIFTLTIQSLAMEKSKTIVKILVINLKLVVQQFTKSQDMKEEFSKLLFDDQQIDFLFGLLFAYQIDTFDSFLFIEAKNFDPIYRDYYKIIVKPLSPDEIQDFYYNKMHNLCKALAIVLSHSSLVATRVIERFEATIYPPEFPPDQKPPIHEGHFMYVLTMNYYVQHSNEIAIENDILDKTIQTLNQSVNEDQISLNHFIEIENLYMHIDRMNQILAKHNKELEMSQIFVMQQLLQESQNQMKLVNIEDIKQHMQNMMICIGQCKIPEIYECFSSLTSIFSSLFNYASTLTNRIKGMTAVVHVKMVNQQRVDLQQSLNNIIKPLLSEAKQDKVNFIQKLNAKMLVDLVHILSAKTKLKPCQQIFGVLIKAIEAFDDKLQEQGIRHIFNYLIRKDTNLLKSTKEYLLNYLKQPITQDNCAGQVKVTFFIIDRIYEKQRDICAQLYSIEHEMIQQQVQHCLMIEQNNEQLPQLIEMIFTLWPQQQVKIASCLIKMMESRIKIAFSCLIRLLESKNEDFLKFIPVFILPVIQNLQYSKMIFSDEKQITLILAQLLQLLPLNLASISDLADGKGTSLLSELQVLAKEGYDFLQTFVNNQMVKEYVLHIPVNAQLREYQKQGITWMATLSKYNLNCALCDDMGLGKTLQSLCVVLNESFLKRQVTGERKLNLIVCPTTITHNWDLEIQKFFSKQFRSVVYEGSSEAKKAIVKNKDQYDVIIASYDKVRSELSAFSELNFFYLVLDEAHIIKNGKAKVTQAIKKLRCDRKIVLTGTPLQNKVSELWSIFDFLMPGFLEEENVFNKRYNQYLTTNIKKLSEKLEETQAFLDALKSLKKRIQPFILRRTKTEVLKELPPKIIQDYPCKMTIFQERIYSIIDKQYPITQALESGQNTAVKLKPLDQQKKGPTNKILANLILHRKACNHPMFVAEICSSDSKIKRYLSEHKEDKLNSYEESGKLLGLVELLTECEIIENKKGEGHPVNNKEEIKESHISNSGLGQSNSENIIMDMANLSTSPNFVAGEGMQKHRVLLFCQMGSFLKMIVSQVLDRFGVKYMQLLSSQQGKQRLETVQQFNNDPSVQVLILTTQVGGLGLNLTGADTVIFAEHDWNPMKDLQAIDRAHRIGQTRNVNVYRLIMCDTLEEKIMSLQKFKQNLAKSLVQSQGASLEDASSLEMSDLLKSFEDHSANEVINKRGLAAVSNEKIIDNLEDAWKTTNFEDM